VWHFWGFCAGGRPVPRGLFRAVQPPPSHPPAGSAFLPSTGPSWLPRLTFLHKRLTLRRGFGLEPFLRGGPPGGPRYSPAARTGAPLLGAATRACSTTSSAGPPGNHAGPPQFRTAWGVPPVPPLLRLRSLQLCAPGSIKSPPSHTSFLQQSLLIRQPTEQGDPAAEMRLDPLGAFGRAASRVFRGL
jgi:hypothetical protein